MADWDYSTSFISAVIVFTFTHIHTLTLKNTYHISDKHTSNPLPIAICRSNIQNSNLLSFYHNEMWFVLVLSTIITCIIHSYCGWIRNIMHRCNRPVIYFLSSQFCCCCGCCAYIWCVRSSVLCREQRHWPHTLQTVCWLQFINNSIIKCTARSFFIFFCYIHCSPHTGMESLLLVYLWP